MKILILTNFDVGLYQFRKELINELLKEHEVYISLPYGKLVEPLKEMGCKFIETPLNRRGMNPFKDLKVFLKYNSILKEVKPDLVITYTIKPNIYGGIACRMKKIQYAMNITGLGTAFEGNGVLKKFASIMYRIACKKAKVVFFENVGDKEIFEKENIIGDTKFCVLNGAGVNLDHYTVTEYPEGETTKFLFMGRVMAEKGINELFETMHRLHSEGYMVHLDVLGDYEEDYEEIINKYTEEGWLTYHGYVEDVRPYINNCHCFVLPSWHEGMANTNLEAAASGRPVITSKIHGCMEAVEENTSGYLCEIQNIDDLYDCLLRFINLSIIQKSMMGIYGRKRVEMLFDKNEVVKSTIDSLFN